MHDEFQYLTELPGTPKKQSWVQDRLDQIVKWFVNLLKEEFLYLWFFFFLNFNSLGQEFKTYLDIAPWMNFFLIY